MAAAPPPFPPDPIPVDELVPGTIYKYVTSTYFNYEWGYARFIETEPAVLVRDGFARYGVWIPPNQVFGLQPRYFEYYRVGHSIMKFYPIGLDTSAIPRDRFDNPPQGELLEQIRREAFARRGAAAGAWATARQRNVNTYGSNNNNRRRTNRRRSSRSRRSSRRSRK